MLLVFMNPPAISNYFFSIYSTEYLTSDLSISSRYVTSPLAHIKSTVFFRAVSADLSPASVVGFGRGELQHYTGIVLFLFTAALLLGWLSGR